MITGKIQGLKCQSRRELTLPCFSWVQALSHAVSKNAYLKLNLGSRHCHSCLQLRKWGARVRESKDIIQVSGKPEFRPKSARCSILCALSITAQFLPRKTMGFSEADAPKVSLGIPGTGFGLRNH